MPRNTLQHASQHHRMQQPARAGWGVGSPKEGRAPWGFGFFAYLLRGEEA